MKKLLTIALFLLVVALLAAGNSACGGKSYSSPTAPGMVGTPTPGTGPTPTPMPGY